MGALLFMTAASGAHTVIIAPEPNTTTKLNNAASKNTSNKADDTIQPAPGQYPNWVPNATTIGANGRLIV